MSLINEALRKARFEAARQEAEDAGMPYPSHEAAHPRHRTPLPWLIAGVLGLVLVAATGGLLFWLGQRSAADPVQIGERTSREPIAVTGANAALPADEAAREDATSTKPAAPVADEPQDTAASIAPPTILEPAPQPVKTESRTPAPLSRKAATSPETSRPAPSEPVVGTETRAEAPAETPAATRPATQPVAPPAAQPDPVERRAVTPRPTPERPSEPAAIEVVEAPRPVAAEPVQAPIVEKAAEERVFVGEAQVGGGVVRLEGIAWSRDRPFALINGRVVGAGDHVESLTITSVERSRILLEDDSGSTYVLELR